MRVIANKMDEENGHHNEKLREMQQQKGECKARQRFEKQ